MRRSTPPRGSRSASAVFRVYFDARCMFPVLRAVLCVGASSQAVDRIADRLRFRRIINLRVTLVPGHYVPIQGASCNGLQAEVRIWPTSGGRDRGDAPAPFSRLSYEMRTQKLLGGFAVAQQRFG